MTLDIQKKHDLNFQQRYWMKPTFTSAVTYLKEIIWRKFFRNEGTDVILCTNSFKPMVNMRLLQINNVKLIGSIKFIPAELKWLQWKGCSLKTLTSEFFSHHIAVLDLSESKLTKLWGRKRGDCFIASKVSLPIQLCVVFK